MASLPSVLLIMGVAGAGKSTFGEALSQEFGWPFRDADSFHPPQNVAKMKSGTPLTDEDRWPWLDAIATWINNHRQEKTHGIVTCSALKRAYRQRLMADHDDVRLVYLQGEKALIAKRMAARKDHFMPTSLLDSQFATLEEPDAGEWPIIVAVDCSPRRVKERILAELAG